VTFTATATNGGNAPTFAWRVNGSVAAVTGSVFKTTTLNDGDTVSCQLTSDYLCALPTTALSNEISIAMIPVVQVNINLNGNYLESPVSGTNYQWYLDSGAIAGAVNQTYSPLVNGTYIVHVTDGNGCVLVSTPFLLTTAGIQSIQGMNISASLNPNPSFDHTDLSIVSQTTGKIQIVLSNINNQKQKILFEGRVEKNKTFRFQIETLALEPGVYIIQINNENASQYLRLVVIR
jgi:hypothetical protein